MTENGAPNQCNNEAGKVAQGRDRGQVHSGGKCRGSSAMDHLKLDVSCKCRHNVLDFGTLV